MRNIFTIAGKDLKSFFSTSHAWVLLLLFTLITGWVFSHDILNYQRYTMEFLQNKELESYGLGKVIQPPNIHWVLGGMLIFVGVFFLFLMPLITMRLFAEEKKIGTLEMLFSKPVRLYEVILGKFLASVTLLSLFLLFSAILASILWIVSDPKPSIAPFFIGYLGLFLLGSVFLALGLFITASTSKQIVAASSAFGLALFLFLLQSLARQSGQFWNPILSYISVISHMDSFASGVLDTRDLFYFVSMIFLGLFLTAHSLKSQGWRS